jgi:hypothetical protein
MYKVKFDGLGKSLFVNDFEHFGEKALMMFSVKNANCLRTLTRVLAFQLNIFSAPKMLMK